MAEKLKAAAGSFERLMLPRLNSIDGELKAINTRIDATNTRIDATNTRIDGVEKSQNSLKAELRSEIKAGFAAQDAKIEKVALKLDEMDRKLDIDRRMTTIEAKIKELERKN